MGRLELEYWIYPVSNPSAVNEIYSNPEVYGFEYDILTARTFSPVTFGMEIEQQPTLMENNPICRRLSCRRDLSGPLETQIGVYKTALDMIRDFYDLTEGRAWKWVNEYPRPYREPAGCGSHIHFRPNIDDIIRYIDLSPAEIWSIVWNTTLDVSYVMLPLVVWGIPRRTIFRWATPYGAPFYGRRSERIFADQIRCEDNPDNPDCEYIHDKHIDNYMYLSRSGINSDVGRKPVTFEFRAAEAHPLFAATYVRVVQFATWHRLRLRSSSKFTAESYEKIRRMLEELFDVVYTNTQRRMEMGFGIVVRYYKNTGPIEFVYGRSFWPEERKYPVEKYRFNSLWDLFTTVLKWSFVHRGTPFYRAAAFVMNECDAQKETEECPENFWKAIVARRGEFRWCTCSVDTE